MKATRKEASLNGWFEESEKLNILSSWKILMSLVRMDKCIKWSTDYFIKAHKSGDLQ